MFWLHSSSVDVFGLLAYFWPGYNQVCTALACPQQAKHGLYGCLYLSKSNEVLGCLVCFA